MLNGKSLNTPIAAPTDHIGSIPMFASHFLATPFGQHLINNIPDSHAHVKKKLQERVHAHKQIMRKLINQSSSTPSSDQSSSGSF